MVLGSLSCSCLSKLQFVNWLVAAAAALLHVHSALWLRKADKYSSVRGTRLQPRSR
jgi:hypothetical protein